MFQAYKQIKEAADVNQAGEQIENSKAQQELDDMFLILDGGELNLPEDIDVSEAAEAVIVQLHLLACHLYQWQLHTDRQIGCSDGFSVDDKRHGNHRGKCYLFGPETGLTHHNIDSNPIAGHLS